MISTIHNTQKKTWDIIGIHHIHRMHSSDIFLGHTKISWHIMAFFWDQFARISSRAAALARQSIHQNEIFAQEAGACHPPVRG